MIVKAVISLCLWMSGDVIEHTYKDSISDCLKTKREIEFVQFNAKERLQKFASNKRIDIQRIPKTYLASYLGIQPPSLSRLFRELKNND